MARSLLMICHVMLREEANDIQIGGLADVLEPSSTRSSRGAVGADIAFADTIHVRDLHMMEANDDAPPPSGPVIVNDPDQGTQWMTPFAFPLPPAAEEVSFSTKLRILSSRVRHGLRGSLEEAQDAWSQTSEARTFLERMKALWSLWQWEREDLVRAAAMSGAVFVVVATIGALAIASGETDSTEGIASASGEVRTPRTVDQHTGRVFYPSPTHRTRR